MYKYGVFIVTLLWTTVQASWWIWLYSPEICKYAPCELWKPSLLKWKVQDWVEAITVKAKASCLHASRAPLQDPMARVPSLFPTAITEHNCQVLPTDFSRSFHYLWLWETIKIKFNLKSTYMTSRCSGSFERSYLVMELPKTCVCALVCLPPFPHWSFKYGLI